LLVSVSLVSILSSSGEGRAQEEIEIVSQQLTAEASTARLMVRATTRAGGIEAFALAVRFDHDVLEVVDIAPSGGWMDDNSPDRILSIGTEQAPGEAGVVALAVLIDLSTESERGVIPPSADGGLQEIAVLDVRLKSEEAGDASPSTELRLAPGEARLGAEGPRLINHLVIGGRDYFAGGQEGFGLTLTPGRLSLREDTLLPGDCNRDAGLDISDGVCLLGHLFRGDPPNLPCADAGLDDSGNFTLLDSNGDDSVDLSDGIYIFTYLFSGGPPPVLGTVCVAISGCPDACGD